MLTLGMNYVVVSVLVAVFMLVCVAMILIILIQRPQGGGLSGAFGAGGGDGAGQTAFGTKTGDVLTITTIGVFILYLIIAVGLNFATRPTSGPPAGTSITAPEGAETEIGDVPIDSGIEGDVENAIEDAVDDTGEAIEGAVDGAVDGAAEAAEELIDPPADPTPSGGTTP
ncbi:MAG: preprotein translocase subunit SecG [Planctomycetota bacterium]